MCEAAPARRAYLGYLDEPAEVVILCRDCAGREFGSYS
jgi:hypothetical protein